MTMYDRIRELRIQKGLSQHELALKTGYADRTAISKIEKGQVDIPRSKIQAFANVFGVSPSFLMDGEENNITFVKHELDESEQMLLDLFRSIPADKRQMALEMLRAALQIK